MRSTGCTAAREFAGGAPATRRSTASDGLTRTGHVAEGRDNVPGVGATLRRGHVADAVPRLRARRSFNLLNANQDPTLRRSVLFLEVARDYIPAVKANFVRVVINGESWGVYAWRQ